MYYYDHINHRAPYQYRNVKPVQKSRPEAQPGYIRHDHALFKDQNIPEMKSESCVGHLPYDCVRCHDRRLYPGGPIVTTCRWETCNKPYNTTCFFYRISRLQVALTIFYPENLVHQFVGSTCRDQASVAAENAFKNEIANLKSAKNLSESAINQIINRSAQTWFDVFRKCGTSSAPEYQQLKSSIQIIPWYSLRPIGDWKQFSSIYQLP